MDKNILDDFYNRKHSEKLFRIELVVTTWDDVTYYERKIFLGIARTNESAEKYIIDHYNDSFPDLSEKSSIEFHDFILKRSETNEVRMNSNSSIAYNIIPAVVIE